MLSIIDLKNLPKMKTNIALWGENKKDASDVSSFYGISVRFELRMSKVWVERGDRKKVAVAVYSQQD